MIDPGIPSVWTRSHYKAHHSPTEGHHHTSPYTNWSTKVHHYIHEVVEHHDHHTPVFEAPYQTNAARVHHHHITHQRLWCTTTHQQLDLLARWSQNLSRVQFPVRARQRVILLDYFTCVIRKTISSCLLEALVLLRWCVTPLNGDYPVEKIKFQLH